MPKAHLGRASRQDTDQIYELVNSTFAFEIGETGISYRLGNKYLLRDTARKNLEDMIVLRINRKIIGCVKVTSHNGLSEIGHLAVHPDHQKRGYGRILMDAAEENARGPRITVGIPSCRTDIKGFFENRGFKLKVKKPLGEVEKLYPDEFCEKILARKDVLWEVYLKIKNNKSDQMDDDDSDDN
uniref:N-acetyltransferase domain-containing protein n=1 Tax=Lepeophtheirus salmonis TaxID=72036 RepID=A0A0K2U1T9_LEPSM